jgi:hypothetical protein
MEIITPICIFFGAMLFASSGVGGGGIYVKIISNKTRLR